MSMSEEAARFHVKGCTSTVVSAPTSVIVVAVVVTS